MRNLELLSREQLLDLADVISHFISFDLDYNVLPYVEHAKLYSNYLDICDLLNEDPLELQYTLNAARVQRRAKLVQAASRSDKDGNLK